MFGIDLNWNNIKVIQDAVDGMMLNKRVLFDFKHVGVSNETGNIMMRECSVGDEGCKIDNKKNNNKIMQSSNLMKKVKILTIDEL